MSCCSAAHICPTHANLARRIARKYHSLIHDADDLEQEALLVILEARPVHNPERHGNLEAYLTVCIRSHLSRLVRSDVSRRRREEPFGDEFLDGRPGDEPDPANEAEVNEALELARQCPALRRLLAGEPEKAGDRARRCRALAKLKEELV